MMAGRFILDGSRVPAYILSAEDVRKEQQRLGVEVDGIWGPKTQTAYDKGRLSKTNDMPDSILSGNNADKGVLSMSDPLFSGGDPYAAYAEYLKNRGVKNKQEQNAGRVSTTGKPQIGYYAISPFVSHPDTSVANNDMLPLGFDMTLQSLSDHTISSETAGKAKTNTEPTVEIKSAHIDMQQTNSPSIDSAAVEKLIEDIRRQVNNSDLPLFESRQIEFFLNIIEDTSASDPATAYKVLENMQRQGVENIRNSISFPELRPLNELRKEWNALNRELNSLQQNAMGIFKQQKRTGQFSEDELKDIGERQQELISEMNEKEAQLQYRKYIDMLSAENAHPFYSGPIDFSLRQTIAQEIAELYRNIWYNLDEAKTKQMFEQLYPTLSKVSFANMDISTDYANWKREIRPDLSLGEQQKLNDFIAQDVGDDDIQDVEDDDIDVGDDDIDVSAVGIDYDGYIIDQKKIEGVTYSLGTTPQNGCGWIATYNALIMLKANPDPYEVMRTMENGALALGLAGTDPYYIRDYFKKMGYDAEIYYTKEEVEREAPNADANIWVYGWYIEKKIGAHFVACKKDEDNSDMIFYNAGTYNKGIAKYVGPLEGHYLDTDLFRFMICINKR